MKKIFLILIILLIIPICYGETYCKIKAYVFLDNYPNDAEVPYLSPYPILVSLFKLDPYHNLWNPEGWPSTYSTGSSGSVTFSNLKAYSDVLGVNWGDYSVFASSYAPGWSSASGFTDHSQCIGTAANPNTINLYLVLYNCVVNEICNGRDDNCNTLVDEGVTNACGTCGPTPNEKCDGYDNDCDGQIDESCICVVGSPPVNCPKQYGVCEGTQTTCIKDDKTKEISYIDCNTLYQNIPNYESTETNCGDSLDNDCDGSVDCTDSDCIPNGICTCGHDDTKCGENKICDLQQNVCIDKCTTDDDCGAKVCEVATGRCVIPIEHIPTTCEEATNEQCHSVDTDNDQNTLNCYWDGGCNDITTDTSCEDLGSDQVACTTKLECKINTDTGDCMDIEPIVVGCPPFGGDQSLTCPTNNGICEEPGPNGCTGTCTGTQPGVCETGETCGCSDCIHQINKGGCANNYWCGDTTDGTNSCVVVDDIIDPEVKCEDYGIPNSECVEQGAMCISNENSGLFAQSGIWNIPYPDGEECCLGSCWDGQYEYNVTTGSVQILSYGQCTPLESESEGTRDVYVNGQKQTTPAPCTILPSRRVPFTSIFGILIGLVLITAFYVLRKKH